MVETILSSPFFTQLVLPFLLVFTLIFAILDKSKILGEGKRQINAIIAFVIGLIFITYSYAVGLTIRLMGVMVIIAIILLVFMILYAFVSGGKEFKGERWMKITFGILIGLALLIALLVLTGYWELVVGAIAGGSDIAANLFFVIIIIAAIIIVLSGKKSEGSSSSSE